MEPPRFPAVHDEGEDLATMRAAFVGDEHAMKWGRVIGGLLSCDWVLCGASVGAGHRHFG